MTMQVIMQVSIIAINNGGIVLPSKISKEERGLTINWCEQSDKQQALFSFPDNNIFTGNLQVFTVIYSHLHCKT